MAVVRSDINLYEEPSFDVTYSSSAQSEYFPLTTINDASTPVDFFIQSNDVQFIDLSETKLYLRVKITNEDGSSTETVVAPVNNFLHSMFQQITIHLNEVPITPASNQNAYRAYLETLLAYSKEFKKSQAQSALYFKDKDPSSRSAVIDDGFKSRYDLTKKSAVFEMEGRPFSDLFLQNRLLLPGIDVRISFIRSSPKFCLYSAPPEAGKSLAYKVEILEAKLKMKKHTLTPSLMHERLVHLQRQPALYPLKRVEVKTYSLAKGLSNSINENLLSGLLPERIILGIVSSGAYTGDYLKNPFEFKHYDLSVINITVNGDSSTFLPMKIDFEKNQYIQLYNNLFESLGISNEDVGIDITREEYKNHPLIMYSLRQPLKEGFHIPKYGNVKIDLTFKTPLTDVVTVIVYAEYQATLCIDNNKNVYYKDYTQTSA